MCDSGFLARHSMVCEECFDRIREWRIVTDWEWMAENYPHRERGGYNLRPAAHESGPDDPLGHPSPMHELHHKFVCPLQIRLVWGTGELRLFTYDEDLPFRARG